MKITWLGQAGLLIEAAGRTIMVDPYFSDSAERLNPTHYRRVPVEERYLRMKPDVILCTHNHLDHADPDTLKHFLTEEGSVIVLAPWEAWKTAEKFGGRLNNYVVFNRHTQFTLTGTDPREKIRFTAVKAEHSDVTAVGAVIEADQRRIYITGDTLYNSEIFADLEELDGPIDMLFLPVNGVGNNMNMEDARRFCERVKPGVAVPFHCGMFDEIDLHDFAYEPKLVPQVYQEVKFPG